MKESRKEFIKKAHSAACSEWKTNIEKEFPKLFKKDENGWYKDKEVKGWCVFFENGIMKHGFDGNGDWFEDHNQNYKLRKSDYKATDKEVEEALIKEAKKRGFKEGVRINSKWMPNISANKLNGKFVFDNKFELCAKANSLMKYTIFQNGVWAEIVDTITKEQAEKELGKTILN